ncbi:MAG: WYL domain-containing protein [Saprospiraceae bacterium]|nr:WYL domain-containing protein [Saprospiraceae bacterium]
MHSLTSQVAYQPNDLFDPETWFNDIVGVSKPEHAPVVDVQFETSYLSSRYLETRPIHPSQELILVNNQRYRFSLRVILNHELVNELVRFGNDLRVIGPEVLVGMVEARVQK